MPRYTTVVTFTTAIGCTRTIEHNTTARSEYSATQLSARYVKDNWPGCTITAVQSRELPDD